MFFKVLVCGGRNWTALNETYAALDALPKKPDLIIQGGAKGADILAKDWAWEHHIHFATVPALWASYAKSSGSVRNAIMLNILKPNYCVAFPGGNGTADMVKRCQVAGVPVWQPYG